MSYALLAGSSFKWRDDPSIPKALRGKAEITFTTDSTDNMDTDWIHEALTTNRR